MCQLTCIQNQIFLLTIDPRWPQNISTMSVKQIRNGPRKRKQNGRRGIEEKSFKSPEGYTRGMHTSIHLHCCLSSLRSSDISPSKGKISGSLVDLTGNYQCSKILVSSIHEGIIARSVFDYPAKVVRGVQFMPNCLQYYRESS